MTPARDEKTPTGWKVAGFLLTVAIALLGILYQDARGDIQELRKEVQGLSALRERMGRVEAIVESIDRRTGRIESKLDDALDRNPYISRPGPR